MNANMRSVPIVGFNLSLYRSTRRLSREVDFDEEYFNTHKSLKGNTIQSLYIYWHASSFRRLTNLNESNLP